MHFTLVATTLLGAAAALPSTQLVARAADLSQQVLANLTVVQNDLVTLNNTVNAQKPGSTAYTTDQLVAIVNANTALSNDINSTAATTNASSTWTSAESTSVYNKVNNDLKPRIFSLLDNFSAHYPNFKANGVVGVVHDTLATQRENTRELGNALTSKAVDPAKSNSPALRDSILQKFDTVISKYSS